MTLRTRALLWAALAVGASAAAPRLNGALERIRVGRARTGVLSTALSFTPRVFDFGSVRAGASVKAEFEFLNGSREPIRIEGVKGTCGCVNAQASTSYVEPGAKGKVTASVTTTGRQGPQSFRIQIRTNEGPRGGTVLEIKGAIRMSLRPRPPSVHLGAVAPGSEHTAEVRVEKLEAVKEIAIVCRGDGVSAEKIAEDEKGLTLKVAVKVPWKRGTRGSGVTLTAAEGSLWIPIGWQMPSAFELSAREIEIRDGKGEIVVKPRWPGVTLGQVNVRSLPLEVTREGDRVLFELKDSPFAVPSGAMVEFVPEPLALGSDRVPVRVRIE